VPLSELVLTAYDINLYLREALPALRAAIYRTDLSQAKDILLLHEETIYEEYDVSQALIDNDYSWVFTEKAADPETQDPDGTLIGLTYPLILAYHHPDIFHVRIGGVDLKNVYPFSAIGTNKLAVQTGYREGLRAMWEIVGFMTPEATHALFDACKAASKEQTHSKPISRLLEQITTGLRTVINKGYGLVIERD
jgi:hypothetical protein